MWERKFDNSSMPLSAFSVRNIIHFFDSCERFMLPDGGEIFDSDFHGLQDVFPRLPYPQIIIEYRALGREWEKDILLPTVKSSKRIVFAMEGDSDSVSFLQNYCDGALGALSALDGLGGDSYRDGFIVIGCIDYYPHRKLWIPCYACAVVPHERGGAMTTMTRWREGIKEYDVARKFKVIRDKSTLLPYRWIPVPFLPEFFAKLHEEGGKKFIANCLLDIGGEVRAVFSLMEALSCSNVKTETVEPPHRLNKCRIKRGKNPFLSYKILTLDLPSDNKKSASGTGNHASPRLHLRRGHVRNLSSGRRIWVNSCMVGKPENGILEKTYRVEHHP